jgi:RNA polymerase sigma factor (sigma-70 family)
VPPATQTGRATCVAIGRGSTQGGNVGVQTDEAAMGEMVDEHTPSADDAVADDAVPDESVPDDAVPDQPLDPTRDAAWFEALVHEHATPVHRYLARRTAIDDVEDLTADVLTIAWRRRAEVPAGAELPWLYRTAGFVVANHRRKSRPVLVADVPERAADDDPALHAVRDDQARRALAALSPRDRQIVLLHAWEGLTGEALAQVLGIGRGGADAALSRARSRLAAAWGEQ